MVSADASVLGGRPVRLAVVPDGRDPLVSPRLVGRYPVEAAPAVLAGPVLAGAAGDRHGARSLCCLWPGTQIIINGGGRKRK